MDLTTGRSFAWTRRRPHYLGAPSDHGKFLGQGPLHRVPGGGGVILYDGVALHEGDPSDPDVDVC